MSEPNNGPFFSATGSPQTLVMIGDYLRELYQLPETGAGIASKCMLEWQTLEYYAVSCILACWQNPSPYAIPYHHARTETWFKSATPPNESDLDYGPLLECIGVAIRLSGAFRKDEPKKKKGIVGNLFAEKVGLPRLVAGQYEVEHWPLPGHADPLKERLRLVDVYRKLEPQEAREHALAMRPLALLAPLCCIHPCQHVNHLYEDNLIGSAKFARVHLADEFVPRTLEIERPELKG